MVEAIIFDCFGVFVDSNFKDFCHRYVGEDCAKLKAIGNVDKQACIGKISHEQYIEEVSSICVISTEEASQIISHTPADKKLLKYIQEELHPKYSLGLLSNASRDWLDDLFTIEQLGLFKDKLLSFEVGLVKPDIEIFKLEAKRLGVTPNECVFVDDSMENCEGAKAVGMQVVHYKNV